MNRQRTAARRLALRRIKEAARKKDADDLARDVYLDRCAEIREDWRGDPEPETKEAQ